MPWRGLRKAKAVSEDTLNLGVITPEAKKDPKRQRHCAYCGKVMVEKRYFSSYSTETGEPQYEPFTVCPDYDLGNLKDDWERRRLDYYGSPIRLSGYGPTRIFECCVIAIPPGAETL